MLQRDHPRSCGKDISGVDFDTLRPGSPPLVRERRVVNLIPTRNVRITPARAGKTVFIDNFYLLSQDHPRSCGKDLSAYIYDAYMAGSPPLVRERQLSPLDLLSDEGITPARAGKTNNISPGIAVYWDHPRSCGKDSQ